jgi:hypothetical protein
MEVRKPPGTPVATPFFGRFIAYKEGLSVTQITLISLGIIVGVGGIIGCFVGGITMDGSFEEHLANHILEDGSLAQDCLNIEGALLAILGSTGSFGLCIGIGFLSTCNFAKRISVVSKPTDNIYVTL